MGGEEEGREEHQEESMMDSENALPGGEEKAIPDGTEESMIDTLDPPVAKEGLSEDQVDDAEDALMGNQEVDEDNEGPTEDNEGPTEDNEGPTDDNQLPTEDNELPTEDNEEEPMDENAAGGFDNEDAMLSGEEESPHRMLSGRQWSDEDLQHREQKPYRVVVDIQLPTDDDDFDRLRLEGYEIIATRYPGTLVSSSDPSSSHRIMLRWTTYDEAERGVEDLVWVTIPVPLTESEELPDSSEEAPPGFEVLRTVDFSTSSEVLDTTS